MRFFLSSVFDVGRQQLAHLHSRCFDKEIVDKEV